MTRAELDPNLKQAVAAGTPVEVFDPTTHEVYYLLSADEFQMLSTLNSADFDPRVAYPLVDQIMAVDDLNDPLLELLESYQ
jgi:hypothetical protein